MIKRYSLLIELEGILEDGASLEMREYPDGEWVKWEDVEDLLDELDEYEEYVPDPKMMAARALAACEGHGTVYDYDRQELIDSVTGEVLYRSYEE